MLLLSVLSTLLILCSAGIGRLFLGWKSRFSMGFYPFATALSGILILAFFSQIWSLFAPVDLRFGIVFLAGLILYLWHWDKLFFYALIPSGLIAAFRCSLIVDYGDTGIYHAQVMMGHAYYGVIPGFANLVVQYGYPSSWYSLFAPFFHLAPAEYLLQLPSTLIMQMLLVPSFLILYQKKSKDRDQFLAIVLLSIVFLLSASPVFPSANADLCVMLCYPCLFWMILSIGFRPIIVVLAAMTCAIKLHALALFLFVLVGTLRKRLQPLHIIRCFCILSLILIPSSLDSIFRSGYIFLPLPLPGLMLPWTNFQLDVSRMQQGISEFARWGNHPPPGSPVWGWLESWPAREGTYLYLLILSSLIATFGKRNPLPVLFGLGGCLIFLVIGPSWRYALGALVLLPAWWIAPYYKKTFSALALLALLVKFHLYVKSFPNTEWARYFGYHQYAYRVFERGLKHSESESHSLAAALFYHACQENIQSACEELSWTQSRFSDQDWQAYYRLISKSELGELLRSEGLIYQEIPSTLYLPQSVGEKSARVLSGQLQGNLVSAFLGDSPDKEISYCWTAPLPCAKGDMMGTWEFIDPSQGLSGGIRSIDLNRYSNHLRYLRDLIAQGDLKIVRDELYKKCQSGQQLECALYMRFQAFEQLKLHHTSNKPPDTIKDCLDLLEKLPHAAWYCAYEAKKANLENSAIVLKTISFQIPINDLLSAPGCHRISQAIPCKHY